MYTHTCTLGIIIKLTFQETWEILIISIIRHVHTCNQTCHVHVHVHVINHRKYIHVCTKYDKCIHFCTMNCHNNYPKEHHHVMYVYVHVHVANSKLVGS